MVAALPPVLDVQLAVNELFVIAEVVGVPGVLGQVMKLSFNQLVEVL
jgi:hypothetical protein